MCRDKHTTISVKIVFFLLSLRLAASQCWNLSSLEVYFRKFVMN